MTEEWHYLVNQFDNATNDNDKLAYKASLFHKSRLFERMNAFPLDLDYPILYNRYNPLHLDLETKYFDLINKGGVQKGKTLTLDQELKLLPGRINKYDILIQNVHEKGSERYVELFPKGHKPFYSGSKDNRIAAVGTFNTGIGSEVALAAVKLLVVGTFNDLINARNVQQGAKGSKTTGSGIFEAARYAAMVGQYRNLGFMINKFPETPDMIRPLFDVESLTNPQQTIWRGHLDILENHPALIRTFQAGDMMRLKSTGKGGLMAYLSSTPGGTDSTKVVVAAGQELKFDVALFNVSDYSTHRYLTIINISETFETRFIIELY